MTATDGQLAPATERRVETFLDEMMVEHDVPGLSVAVLDPDGVQYANGLGARCIESRSPATAETLYPIASVTKIVTAIPVMRGREIVPLL